MKLSAIAFLGLLVLGSAGCSLSQNQAQAPGTCQSGEGTNCPSTPGHSYGDPDSGGPGNGTHGAHGGMGGGMGGMM
jgi:hypothetical protein